MPLGTQSKILRVLVDQQLHPRRRGRQGAVDLRVISSTNRDLPGEIRRDASARSCTTG
jgi:two-component system nitrogen regulation response regulator NtrX